MISIGDLDIPTPSDCSIGINDIIKEDRTANGNVIIERVATKRKIDLSWKYLSNTQLQELMTTISANVFFTVSYPDPLTGATRSGTFYVGDRSAGMIDYQAGVPRWKDIKLNLLEK